MKNNTKLTLVLYWKHAIKYKWLMFWLILGVVGGSAVGAILPLSYKNLFNLLAAGNQNPESTIKSLFGVLGILALLKLLVWVFWRVASLSLNKFEPAVMKDLNNYSFAYLHKHSFAYFNSNFTGSMVKRVKSFVSAFETVADQIIWEIIPNVINLFIIIFVLLGINIILGVSMLIGVIILLFVNWVFSRYKLKFDLKRTEAETKSTGLLADTITNSNNVKLFNGYNFELNKFDEVMENLKYWRVFTWNLGAGFEAVQRFLMLMLELGLIFTAIILWKNHALTVGDFVLLQTYLLTVFNISSNFGRVLRRLYESLADAVEMTDVLTTAHEIIDVANAPELAITDGEIKFEDVTFNYNSGRRIIEKLNLNIKPQERVAIIGPSGAGKTTLIKLLLRMHDVEDGRIMVDGQDISKVTQESLWKNISLVPQDPILFHRTLFENIQYGKQDATKEEVIRAAKLANAHQFIESFPDKYETYVGERGVKLSGGERQRVAIARAILRNAPILILDEATSSLDSESEGMIQEALEKLMKGKTVIVVAHRLSTIRKSDRIIVVDKSGIAEQGSHEELIKKDKGIYKKLWELQVCGFIQ